MLWFLVLILYICFICAATTPIWEGRYIYKGRKPYKSNTLPPVWYIKTEEISPPVREEKDRSDYGWLFELGF